MNRSAASISASPTGAMRRLLAALAEPGASAIPDPTREESLILCASRPGISLGRGSHPEAAARELASRDLAERSAAPGGRGWRYVITETGRAAMRRAAASRSDDNPFGTQHRDLVEEAIPEDDGPARVSLNTAESPLDWLRRRKGPDGRPLIDAACFEAGERLRRDLTFGGMLPSVTARWEGGGTGQGRGGLRDPAAATDAVVAARQRVRAALDEIGGDFAGLLVDLCGFLKGLETIERDRCWPARSAKVVVRLALRRLADHYGLESEARGPARSLGLRGWAEEARSP